MLLAGSAEIFYAAVIPNDRRLYQARSKPVLRFFIAASMYLLSLATRTIAIGTACAIWVGIGALGTAGYGLISLGDDRSPLRLFRLMLILAGTVGLKLLSSDEIIVVNEHEQ